MCVYYMGMDGTKWKLFNVSIELFAEKGYDSVSVRNIAQVAGIKASSIYNHFTSKQDILDTIYKFYDYYYSYFNPRLDDIMNYIGQEPPVDTLKRTLFRYDPSIQDLMDKIFLLASTRLYCDREAQNIIFNNLFILAETRMSAILNRMIELDLIETLDIGSFVLTLGSLCHSAALRMKTNFPIDWEVWVRSVDMLFEQVKEKPKFANNHK